jgi:hypothetical protein
MKNSWSDSVRVIAYCKRNRKVLLIVAVACCAPALSTFFASAQAPAQLPGQSNVVPQQVVAQAEADRVAAVILVKNALVAVNQGNLTGNYTVLRDLSSPGFREKNSAADLAAIFQNIRQQKIDLSPIIVMEPMLSQPQTNAQGQLVLSGYFPTQQLRINFQLVFLKAGNGGWLIHGVSINAVPEVAAAMPGIRR